MARVISTFRSSPSRKGCWLRVINKTSRTVNIIWIDYHGREINYALLKPKDTQTIHTYEGHPWLCRDSVSNRRLLLNKNEIFVHQSAPLAGGVNVLVPVVEVVISIPMLSMLDISADLVTRCISFKKDIQSLELPTALKDHVTDCFNAANTLLHSSFEK
ncbi:VHL domain-containing protein [Trichonephila inaurata madagascariensis]|uniref:VHL domain-containing protein n=1 Tax=Trichonephila inaurata madagascariensis TaxID=2747483 RepID=A0A8X7CCA1_9ARAC|nr:VHL domain-containing protein [Trichonephila inaurata madagascariensis]